MERRNSLGYGRQQSHSCPHPMVCLGMTMSHDRRRKKFYYNLIGDWLLLSMALPPARSALQDVSRDLWNLWIIGSNDTCK